MSDSSFTPELATVLKNSVLDVTGDWHYSCPGIVESYDATKQTVTVQPALKRSYFDLDGNETVVNYPLLLDVPVVFPKGGGFALTFPINKGDNCWLMFSERSIEIWKRDGGVVDPDDFRRHHLSDAVALIGISPSSSPLSGVDASKVQLTAPGPIELVGPKSSLKMSADGGVTINNGSGTIELTSDGKFVLSGEMDLLQQIINLAKALTEATVLTAFGPQQILPPQSNTILQTLQNLQGLKGT